MPAPTSGNKICLWALAIIASCALYGNAKAFVSVEAQVDRQTIHVGDPIVYTLRIRYDVGDTIVDIPAGLNLQALVIRDFSKDTRMATGDGRLEDLARYTLSLYRLGKFAIPPVPVEYVLKDGRRGELITAPIEITVESLGVAASDSLRDIKPPASVPEKVQPWVFLSGTLLIAGLALAIFLWRKKSRSVTEISPEPVKLDWYAELSAIEAKGLLDSDELRQHFDQVNTIFRLYLERRYRCDIMEMTTREVLDALSVVGATMTHRQMVEGLLKECDMVKFAKHDPPEDDAKSLIDRTRLAIDATRDPIENHSIQNEPEAQDTDGLIDISREPVKSEVETELK